MVCCDSRVADQQGRYFRLGYGEYLEREAERARQKEWEIEANRRMSERQGRENLARNARYDEVKQHMFKLKNAQPDASSWRLGFVGNLLGAAKATREANALAAKFLADRTGIPTSVCISPHVASRSTANC